MPESADKILRKSICDFAYNHSIAESDVERISTDRIAMEFIMKTVRMDCLIPPPATDISQVPSYEGAIREAIFYYIGLYEEEKRAYNHGRNNG